MSLLYKQVDPTRLPCHADGVEKYAQVGKRLCNKPYMDLLRALNKAGCDGLWRHYRYLQPEMHENGGFALWQRFGLLYLTKHYLQKSI